MNAFRNGLVLAAITFAIRFPLQAEEPASSLPAPSAKPSKNVPGSSETAAPKSSERVITIKSSSTTDFSSLRDEIAKEGSRWIGLRLVDVPDALRKHLPLAENEGMMVREVFPNSPASKAGFLEFDIVISAGGQSLTNFDVLKNALDHQTAPLKVEILRKGAKVALEVAPESRKKPPIAESKGNPFMATNSKTMKQWPRGVSVQITVDGDQQLHLTVERDGNRWKASTPLSPRHNSIDLDREPTESDEDKISGESPKKNSTKGRAIVQEMGSGDLPKKWLKEIPADLQPFCEQLVARVFSTHGFGTMNMSSMSPFGWNMGPGPNDFDLAIVPPKSLSLMMSKQILDLNAQIVKKEIEHRTASQKYGRNHPEVKKLGLELDTLKEVLQNLPKQGNLNPVFGFGESSWPGATPFDLPEFPAGPTDAKPQAKSIPGQSLDGGVAARLSQVEKLLSELKSDDEAIRKQLEEIRQLLQPKGATSPQ